MADILYTSVSVGFGEGDGTDGALLWESDPERTTDSEGTKYLRLYPAAPEKLIVTSGNLSTKGNYVKQVEDVSVFTGDTEITINHPKVDTVSIEQLGSTYGLDGVAINVTFTYNATKRTVTASSPCYGAVRIKYTAPYQLYLFGFAGSPCILPDDPDKEPTGGYSDSVIIAVNITPPDTAVAYTTLTPQSCASSSGTSSREYSSGNVEPPNIVLEVDKDFPPRITGSTTNGVHMGCKVRQIPDVAATIDISSGTYKPEEFASSSSIADSDTPIFFTSNYTPKNTEEVVDIVTFNAGSSAKLKYQPASAISVDTFGPVLDEWGNSITPTFAKPGDKVTEVDWISEHTYTNPRSREVREDEIVALTANNKTINVYGSAKAKYTIRYKVFDVTFKAASFLPEDGYNNIHMLATYQEQSEYLFIEAPSMKEK